MSCKIAGKIYFFIQQHLIELAQLVKNPPADSGSIPGLGRSSGEGIGNPLQYSWASFVAQMVKNPPAMRETWVEPLGWEDPLEEGMATHASIQAWRIPLDRGGWWAIIHRGAESRTWLSTAHSTMKGNVLGPRDSKMN